MKKIMIMVIIAVMGTLLWSTECGKGEVNFKLADGSLNPIGLSRRIKQENLLCDCIHDFAENGQGRPTWISWYLACTGYYDDV